jgi:hypothetical protein
MRRLWCVLFMVLSAAAVPSALHAQQGAGAGNPGPPEHGFRVLQNYPNPFGSDTRIPFELHEDAFIEGRAALVSMQIYNVLREPVATPTALGHPAGDGTPIIDLEYGVPGRHEVYWDGRNRSGAQVASGVYLLEMTVNGRPKVLKMYVLR